MTSMCETFKKISVKDYSSISKFVDFDGLKSCLLSTIILFGSKVI